MHNLHGILNKIVLIGNWRSPASPTWKKKSSDCGILEKSDGINGIAVSQEVTRCFRKGPKIFEVLLIINFPFINLGKDLS